MRSSRERDRIFNNQPNNNQGMDLILFHDFSARSFLCRNRDRAIRVRVTAFIVTIWRDRNRYSVVAVTAAGLNFFQSIWYLPIQVRTSKQRIVFIYHRNYFQLSAKAFNRIEPPVNSVNKQNYSRNIKFLIIYVRKAWMQISTSL